MLSTLVDAPPAAEQPVRAPQQDRKKGPADAAWEGELVNSRLRAKEIERRRRCSHGKLYGDIQDGTFIEGIKLSHKDVFWWGSEFLAISAAERAGWTKEQRRALVNKLREQRKQDATKLLEA
jgi:hypothetical protein